MDSLVISLRGPLLLLSGYLPSLLELLLGSPELLGGFILVHRSGSDSDPGEHCYNLQQPPYAKLPKYGSFKRIASLILRRLDRCDLAPKFILCHASSTNELMLKHLEPFFFSVDKKNHFCEFFLKGVSEVE
jgi:hypothetical protein